MSKSKATDDCNLRFDVGPAVEVVTSTRRYGAESDVFSVVASRVTTCVG
jgi:hypothetical protein